MKFLLGYNFLATLSAILFTLAKQSRQLGAFKLARHAFDKIQVRKFVFQHKHWAGLDHYYAYEAPNPKVSGTLQFS